MGNTGLFNHITVYIRIINSVYKVMAFRFNNPNPFNFRYFIDPKNAEDYASELLREYKWRL